MNNSLTLAVAVLGVLLIWRLLRRMNSIENLLYFVLTRDDNRPGSGDQVVDTETGQTGQLLWRRWDGVEERAVVDFGLDHTPRAIPLSQLKPSIPVRKDRINKSNN